MPTLDLSPETYQRFQDFLEEVRLRLKSERLPEVAAIVNEDSLVWELLATTSAVWDAEDSWKTLVSRLKKDRLKSHASNR